MLVPLEQMHHHNEGGQGTEMAGKNNVAGGDHGAQHGHGFGRGAYRH
jgi:hypothetical protein